MANLSVLALLCFCGLVSIRGHPAVHDTVKKDMSQDVENDLTSSSSETTEPTESNISAELAEDLIEVLNALNLTDLANDTLDSATADSSGAPVTSSSTDLYMTGSHTLDKLMSCPCQHDQLTAMGIQGYVYDPQGPTPQYPHGSNELLDLGNFFQENWNRLNLAGGSRMHIFTQVLRLLLSIPNFKIQLLRPVLIGAENTFALASKGVAGVTEHVARQIPIVARAKADILRRLIEAFGDVAGSLIYILSQLFSAMGSAKYHLANNGLPHALDVVSHTKQGVTSVLGSVVDGVAGAKQVVANGVVEAVKTKGKLVGSVIHGGHQQIKNAVQQHHPKEPSQQYGPYGPESHNQGYGHHG